MRGAALIARIREAWLAGDVAGAEALIAQTEPGPARDLADGTRLLLTGDAEAAYTHLAAAAATAADDDDGEARRLLATASLILGDPGGAEREAAAALGSTNARHGLLWQLIGVARLGRGALEGAREAFARAAEDPEAAGQAHLHLGRLAWGRADWAGAARHLRLAVEADDDVELGHHAAVEGWRAMGQAAGALALADVTRGGHHPEAVYDLLDLLCVQLASHDGRPVEGELGARPFAAAFVARSGGGRAAAVSLFAARLFAGVGLLDEAKAALAAVDPAALPPELRSEPDYLRGVVAGAEGRDDDALQHYRAAVAAARFPEDRLDARANALALLLRAESLSPTWSAWLAELPPWLAETYGPLALNAAICRGRDGDLDGAADALEALRESPHLETRRAASALLREMRGDEPPGEGAP